MTLLTETQTRIFQVRIILIASARPYRLGEPLEEPKGKRWGQFSSFSVHWNELMEKGVQPRNHSTALELGGGYIGL